ncbi:triphosphoribosyl-dephospho-CoA synthase [Erwinia toletana]|uniref:Probable 2-(5''-triphosphoribosyl)-3'-dephosphocoenzyme-A synthase n=1 Tax=Winslowiella toletana TaxID=92490 RepID=A0ABS4P460_9GAMM|nr:triphosphoribosyl-dephospho-CoA synthase CitG [Winslowiella toletana]MBP2167432.1 triphosphoribosyl-dephospho-CoA synthase [Winslowiella toletana]
MPGLPVINPALALTDTALLSEQALLQEVWLTPKPGLVDASNSGAHRDMDLPLFLASIAAIAPWFAQFVTAGQQAAELPAMQALAQVRPVGIACEQAMFSATAGVNSHKGGIFSLGLLCFAAGRLTQRALPLSQASLCAEVAALCRGLVMRELQQSGRQATVGERLYQRYGLSGARGEAQSGFATVRRYVLPYWYQEQDASRRLLAALLRLMAVNADTNLVSRGGLAGLRYVQQSARQLLNSDWQIADLQAMDQQLTLRNLSPGGSADLLAVSMVLAAFPA